MTFYIVAQVLEIAETLKHILRDLVLLLLREPKSALSDVLFKWPIIPYFFWKNLQLQIKCASSMTIQVNC